MKLEKLHFRYYNRYKLVFSYIVVFEAGLSCCKSKLAIIFCSLLGLLMMNANSHFGTLRYPLIMFTFVAHYLNNK